ncbi:MAG TPA: ABC transporter ATP-binding protein [Geothermobacteraceae bacterium]|nr:ABC transporter ATP-binding protein [Geothermobacteraceae bacterium]
MTAASLEDFSYAWPDAEDWTLRELSLELPQGECHCLTGATGSGKTTLALAFKELLPSGRRAGCLRCPAHPGEAGTAVGLVLQNPATQILTETLGAEVAFGLENLCLPPEQMPERVRTALDAVGLDLPFDHPTARLSMGEKYRLLAAAQLVLEPALLILDEPAGQLDGAGLQRLAEIIARLKHRGLAVLLCEHRPSPLTAVIDRHWHLDAEGRLREGEAFSAPKGVIFAARMMPADEPPVVEVKGLSVAADDATPAWQEAQLVLRRGERVLLCAPNGTGKTTLLRCLAGFLTPERGTVRVFGQQPQPRKLRGRVGFLFQNPRRQLFETTVFAEVAFSLRRLGIPRAQLEARVLRSLECCGIVRLAWQSPHQLSYGQQHLVALAAVLAAEPELLLLDDPLAGLDPTTSAVVCEALVAASEQHGTAILWTSHHPPNGQLWSHRVLRIEGGALVVA